MAINLHLRELPDSGDRFRYTKPSETDSRESLNLNLTALEGSGYRAADAPFPRIGSTRVYRYIFQGSGSKEGVSKGADAVRQLIRDNQALHPLFNMNDTESFSDMIKNCIHLVINRQAVCLSDQPKATDVDPKYMDTYFSESLLQEPVQCSKGHNLEKKYAEFWKSHVSAKCPVDTSGQHDIGSMIVNVELQELKRIEDNYVGLQEKNKKILELLKLNSLYAEIAVADRMKANTFEIKTDIGKLVAKMEAELILRCSENVLSAATLKIASQCITGGSLGLGIALGFYNFSQGQWKRGCIEIVSGGIGFIPMGEALLASMVVDLGLLIADATDEGFVVEPNVEQLHKLMGLDYPLNSNPKKEELIAAYKQQRSLLDPQKWKGMDAFYQENQFAQMKKILKDSIKALLNHYQYSWQEKEILHEVVIN